jgi:hypothetical protein
MASGTKVANGNITPSSFVKIDTSVSGGGKVVLSGAGEDIYGISQPGVRNYPGGTGDDGYAAIAGENVMVYVPPEKEVLLRLGGTVTAGDWLKSDASGFGVTSSSDREKVGARASRSGVSGDLIPVQVIIGERSTA